MKTSTNVITLVYIFYFLDLLDRWLCFHLPFRFRLKWRELWIRYDEFHPSLSYDPEAWKLGSEEAVANYSAGLCQQRAIAHERDLIKSSARLTSNQ